MSRELKTQARGGTCQTHLQIQMLFSRVVDEVSGQCSRRGAVREDDGVLGIFAPLDEQFSGESGLEVRLAA